MQKKYGFLLLLCTCTTILMAQPANESITIKMPFGKDNYILYALDNGSYTVYFNGKQLIGGAQADYGTLAPASTQATAKRKHAFKPWSDAWGKGTLHTFSQNMDGRQVQQLFYTYPGKPFFFTQIKVQGRGAVGNYLSPLTTHQLSLEAAGDRRALSVPFDNDMWVRFDAQAYQQANYTSSEVTALYSNDNKQGLIIGSIEHKVWKSGIKVQHNNDNTVSLVAFSGLSDSSITHDKVVHGKVSVGDTLCASPKFMIGLFPDWRAGMEQYAAANALAEPPVIESWKKATPIGWNSWGAIQTKLNLDKAKGVVDFFNDSCKGFRNADGTLYIDLDSFWDNMVKGGLNGDVSALKEFVQYCVSRKMRPGIYWAPFADWGKHDRSVEGSSSYRYPATWVLQQGKPVEVDGALAMDPTHPATKQRIVHYINKFKELGFEMIKIDFLGHGALESERFYNPAVTTGMQAYAEGMAFLDSVLAGKMLVYAAISPTMATARYVHMRRIACDAFSAIDNTEYTLNSTGYGWWQTKLYQYVDADHVVFNTAPAGTNRARLASALVTGTLITGDDFSAAGEWRAAAKQFLQNKDLLAVIKDGRAFRPVEANTGRKAVELFTKTVHGQTWLAVFNYDNDKRSYSIPVEKLGFAQGTTIKCKELFTQIASFATGEIKVDIPSADVKLYLITK